MFWGVHHMCFQNLAHKRNFESSKKKLLTNTIMNTLSNKRQQIGFMSIVFIVLAASALLVNQAFSLAISSMLLLVFALIISTIATLAKFGIRAENYTTQKTKSNLVLGCIFAGMFLLKSISFIEGDKNQLAFMVLYSFVAIINLGVYFYIKYKVK